jgi:hypothetical protein
MRRSTSYCWSLEIYDDGHYGDSVSVPTPTDVESIRRRRVNLRLILGIVILLLLTWCYSISRRLYTVWHQGDELAHGSSRLESVDTTLAPGSRVEFNGAKVADLRSTGYLGAAAAHPNMDTIALFQRWPALTAFVKRDSARFSKERGGPTQGLAVAQRFVSGAQAGELYLAEFLVGADTGRLAHDSTLYATVDSSTGPIIVQLRAGSHPAGPMRGELFIGPPSVLYPVY